MRCMFAGDVDTRLLVPIDDQWHLVGQFAPSMSKTSASRCVNKLLFAETLGQNVDFGYRDIAVVRKHDNRFEPLWLNRDGNPYSEFWIRRRSEGA